MNRFVLKKTFLKIYLYHFLINIFIKTKRLKLEFRDCVIVQNDCFMGTEEVPCWFHGLWLLRSRVERVRHRHSVARLAQCFGPLSDLGAQPEDA